MDTIYGDITKIPLFRGGSIIHQGNMQKVAGAGVALAIRRAWPNWYIHFTHKNGVFGGIDAFPVQASPPISIITLYAQNKVGRWKRQTDYAAFSSALQEVRELYRMRIIPSPLYMPYKIGCGNGGGDWGETLQLIQEHLPNVTFVSNETEPTACHQ